MPALIEARSKTVRDLNPALASFQSRLQDDAHLPLLLLNVVLIMICLF